MNAQAICALQCDITYTPYQSLHAGLTRLLYIRSNLWSRRENTSAMAVLLLIMHTARCTLARSPPGSTDGKGEPIADQQIDCVASSAQQDSQACLQVQTASRWQGKAASPGTTVGGW
jgi:hypothetical protein